MTHDRKRSAFIVGAIAALILGGALLTRHGERRDGETWGIETSPSALDFKVHESHANRWGGRVLLSVDPVISKRSTAVILDTPMMDRPYLWRLDFLFSQPATEATPSPRAFTPLAVCPTRITVRHGIDDRQGTVDDVYNLSNAAAIPVGSNGVILPVWMPISSVRTRKLTIIAEVFTGDDGHGQIFQSAFVDVGATPITAVDTEQIVAARGGRNIFGFGNTFTARTAATAGPAVLLMPADAARTKFWIVNKGTTNLFVGFGTQPDLTVGTESFTIELLPGATYESQPDQFWGDIFGVWDGAPGANDYGLVTVSNIFA